jgi:hypothetical protein
MEEANRKEKERNEGKTRMGAVLEGINGSQEV